MFVIGTAGHVDHGKSTLVHALTGIDPDRLREEKERGLTIDLGFAWLELPSGREVSIVDVPGHERFIKNMLAGAGGVDLALLVVAADEGPMPQTREHLAILDLLDVPGGVVVLTKCDLVEGEFAALVEAELEEALRGSMLDGAPVVRVSAVNRTGLDELLVAIDSALERAEPKRDLGRARLPIDRAFTIQGFGTVVTGTLVDGALVTGQDVELMPGRMRARVRGLQRHRTKVSRLEPGTRAAVNLSGVHVEDLERGMVLAAPGVLSPVRAVDVRFRATAILEHPVAHDAGVTFLSATSETEARLRLLDREDVGPSDEAWAQVVLSRPIALRKGDRCVLRSPNETLGGGVIVGLNPRRHRRHHQPTLDALALQLAGSPEERLLEGLAAAPIAAPSVAGQLGLGGEECEALIARLKAAGSVVGTGQLLLSRVWLDSAAGRASQAVADFLASNPLRATAPREHVRSVAAIPAAAFDAVVEHARAAGRLAVKSQGLAPPDYEVRLSDAQHREIDRFLASIRAGGYSPPTDALPEPPLIAYLVEQGVVEDTGGGAVYPRETFDEMVAIVRAHADAGGSLSLADVRDLFGTTRKYAQAFLEHLDALHITRRVGDSRILLGGGDRT